MASKFWVPQPVSNAIVSVASPPQIRLTVTNTSGITNGDTRIVSGVVGTTEANGTWVVTLIDGTHIDLQGSTFSNLYTSGGSVNGRWDANNTNNWATASGGSTLTSIPGSADAATFDGSSGTGTVGVSSSIGGTNTVTSITAGAYAGTLDFSLGNPSITYTGAFSVTGTATRTINLGSGTFTNTGNAVTMFDCTTATGLTATFQNCSFVTAPSSGGGAVIFTGGGQSYGSLTANARTNGTELTISSASNSFVNVTLNGAVRATFPGTVSNTISGSFTLNGSSSGLVSLASSTTNAAQPATLVLTTATISANWAVIKGITASGQTLTANSSFSLGANTLVTANPPTSGGSDIIGA